MEARLAAGHDALDALAATFPAGTVSGAPKLRALQLVAELEPETRGPYGGCFGYLDGAGLHRQHAAAVDEGADRQRAAAKRTYRRHDWRWCQ